MLSNLLLTTVERNASNTSRLASRLVGVVVLVIIFMVPSAFGQSDYSVAWVDDSNPDAGYIVGAGVTDNDYSADAMEVATTLTSPAGRTVTGYSDGVGSAFAEVTLPWDWSDIGDYFVHSTHQPYCVGNWDGSLILELRHGSNISLVFNPNYFRCLESRMTSNEFGVGISHAVYESAQCQSDGCLYLLIPNCTTSCKSQTIKVRNPSFCHSYAIRNTAYHQGFIGPRICFNLTATTEVSDNPGLCWDESLVP